MINGFYLENCLYIHMASSLELSDQGPPLSGLGGGAGQIANASHAPELAVTPGIWFDIYY
jgi:hypothetical protein